AQPTGVFTSGLPVNWSPDSSPDIATVSTGQVPRAGLAPARMAASIAGPHPRTLLPLNTLPLVLTSGVNITRPSCGTIYIDEASVRRTVMQVRYCSGSDGGR